MVIRLEIFFGLSLNFAREFLKIFAVKALIRASRIEESKVSACQIQTFSHLKTDLSPK